MNFFKDAKNIVLTPDFKELWNLRKPIFYKTDLKSNGTEFKKNIQKNW